MRGKIAVKICIILGFSILLGACGNQEVPEKIDLKTEESLTGGTGSFGRESIDEVSAEEDPGDHLGEDCVVLNISVTDPAGKVEATIFNGSDSVITAGYVYRLQQWKEDSWKEIQITTVYPDIGIEISPENQYHFSYDLETFVRGSKGTFRILKSVYANQSEIRLEATFELQ